MAKAPPSFDLYPGDLIKSCTAMDAEVFGAYMRLLCYQWEHGYIVKNHEGNHMVSGADFTNNHMVSENGEMTPETDLFLVCSVPADRWPSVWARIKPRLEPIDDNGSLGHKRLAEQRLASIKLWEKRRQNGKLGGRPQNKPHGSTSGTLTEGGSNKNRSSKEEKRVQGEGKPNRPPTLEDVRAYFESKGTLVSPDEFFAYYDANGWRQSNGNKIRNWKSCLTTWESKRQAVRQKPKGFKI